MTTARSIHTATLLNNGQVLIAGGTDSSGNFTASAELYDTATGTFVATASMTSARASHQATLLNSGLVLVEGGNSPSGAPSLASAELYHPVETPTQLVTELVNTTNSLNLQQGIDNSLDAKLQAALAALSAAKANDITTACSQINAFLNEVMAQSGKKLTVAQANQLIAQANAIMTALGCT